MKVKKAVKEKVKQAVKRLKVNDKRRCNVKTASLGAE